MLVLLKSVKPKFVQIGNAAGKSIAIHGDRDVLLDTDQIESARRLDVRDGVPIDCTRIKTKTGDVIDVASTPAEIAAKIGAELAAAIAKRGGRR